jgi:Uma2 family endonuclease
MVVKIPEATILPSDGGAIEPLRDGERMNADEFFRRYSSMPEVKKAELINGVVYMASPVAYVRHANPHLWLGNFLGQYGLATPGILAGDNGTVMLGDADQPQPDLFLGNPVEGRCRLNDRGYVIGAPELVAEVSASFVTRDSGPRFEMYRSFGVQEYLIWVVDEERFDWYRLRNEVYEILPRDDAGIIRSEVFPGLWLDTRAMLESDWGNMVATLQNGMATEEYQRFAASLRTSQ